MIASASARECAPPRPMPGSEQNTSQAHHTRPSGNQPWPTHCQSRSKALRARKVTPISAIETSASTNTCSMNTGSSRAATRAARSAIASRECMVALCRAAPIGCQGFGAWPHLLPLPFALCSPRMPRGDLFPEIGPFETGTLPLSDGHVMYWEQVGNPRGAPVLFLHGGPGAGAGAVHRRFFDPGFWRVVVFDQRGGGRPRPLGNLRSNTTPDLVADIEVLRRHLRIERLLLFGGSWGSTLALAYAQAYPDRVAGLVLRGVFLGRAQEVDWFLHGLATIFPDAHAAFAGFLPEAERGDLLANNLRRLTEPDPEVHM